MSTSYTRTFLLTLTSLFSLQNAIAKQEVAIPKNCRLHKKIVTQLAESHKPLLSLLTSQVYSQQALEKQDAYIEKEIKIFFGTQSLRAPWNSYHFKLMHDTKRLEKTDKKINYLLKRYYSKPLTAKEQYTKTQLEIAHHLAQKTIKAMQQAGKRVQQSAAFRYEQETVLVSPLYSSTLFRIVIRALQTACIVFFSTILFSNITFSLIVLFIVPIISIAVQAQGNFSPLIEYFGTLILAAFFLSKTIVILVFANNFLSIMCSPYGLIISTTCALTVLFELPIMKLKHAQPIII